MDQDERLTLEELTATQYRIVGECLAFILAVTELSEIDPDPARAWKRNLFTVNRIDQLRALFETRVSNKGSFIYDEALDTLRRRTEAIAQRWMASLDESPMIPLTLAPEDRMALETIGRLLSPEFLLAKAPADRPPLILVSGPNLAMAFPGLGGESKILGRVIDAKLIDPNPPKIGKKWEVQFRAWEDYRKVHKVITEG